MCSGSQMSEDGGRRQGQLQSPASVSRSYCDPSIWKRTGSSRTHGSNARRLKEAICGTGKSLPIWLEFESFTNLWLKMTPESFSSIQMA